MRCESKRRSVYGPERALMNKEGCIGTIFLSLRKIAWINRGACLMDWDIEKMNWLLKVTWTELWAFLHPVDCIAQSELEMGFRLWERLEHFKGLTVFYVVWHVSSLFHRLLIGCSILSVHVNRWGRTSVVYWQVTAGRDVYIGEGGRLVRRNP